MRNLSFAITVFLIETLAFGQDADIKAQNQFKDTVYYNSGDKVSARITVLDGDDLGFYVVTNNGELLFKVLPKYLFDSVYVSSPSKFISELQPPKVGTNLIVSGIMSLVATGAAVIGAWLNNLEAGLAVSGIASIVSVSALINAGVVSNSQEPPSIEKELPNVIVF